VVDAESGDDDKDWLISDVKTAAFLLTYASVCSQHPMGTLKPHSNVPLYSNTMIGTLTVDGWTVKFSTARKSLAGSGPG